MFHSFFHVLRSLYSEDGLKQLISWFGPGNFCGLVCAIIFAETGLFAGFFLPGDSLLITAGIFAGQRWVPLPWLFVPGIACAIVGDQLGYWIGRSAGPALFHREDSLFFKRSHLQRAQAFYEKYGGRAVIFARFVPIVRTFCPPVTGAAGMRYSTYLAYDCFGGVLWVGGMLIAGYLLGAKFPNIGKYLHLIIGVVILLSILPPIIGLLRARGAGSESAPLPARGE